MTNFEKLTRWVGDYYKAQSDEECIICLTEKQVYLIGQVIEAIKWGRTRWVGDVIGLDFDEISSNLEHRISERMTCTSIGDLLRKLTQLEDKINYIFNDTAEENGDTVPDETTAPYDRYTPEEFNEEFSFSTDGCTDEDKDALYAGIREFVTYANNANIDALQNIEQAIGNTAQQADRLISAVPIIGLLPYDEAVGYAGFLMDELKDEYEATVDQELLDNVVCDLFCIAVANDCTFRLSDAIDYYGSKIGTDFEALLSDLANVVSFAATGTFSGDQYFYFMHVFQFIAVASGDHYFNLHGAENYMLRVATGLNSPDNDWTLLCEECPPLYRKWTWDGAYGPGEWHLDPTVDATPPGEFAGTYWQGTPDPSNPRVRIAMPHNPAWEILSIGVDVDWTFDIHGGARSVSFRPTAGSTTGQFVQGLSLSADGIYEWCNGTVSSGTGIGINEIAIDAFVGNPAGHVRIKKVVIIYADVNNAPESATITEDDNICD